MKKLIFLLIAATGALSAIAQAPHSPEMPKTKSFVHDSLMLRWVLDVNILGGALTQDITTVNNSNYPGLIAGTYNNGGNMKFSNGASYGFDAQIGYFFGHRCTIGIGSGIMYLSQTGNVTMANPFHAEFQATDYQNNTFRQVVTSNQAIKESLNITNINIPIVLKYKKRFSKYFGFTADAGLLVNVKETNNYSSNATFDYEAIYSPVVGSNGTISHFTYDNGTTPATTDVLYTKASYVNNTRYENVQAYFNALHATGYSVGLGVAPNSNSGAVSYLSSSIGFIAQPSINIFFSDNVALNIGGYYLYQPFKNSTSTFGSSNYQLTGKVGDYSSVLNTVSQSNNQSYGVNVGLRFFFGKLKDTDHDGIPDKEDKCPTVSGLLKFHGCPDSDGDGIADYEDSCVHVPGLLKFHGCPDTDGDGIPDKDDACPFQPGLPQFNGCPDRDGDGIPDKDDLCPDKPGPAKWHGCPDTDGDGIPDNLDKCPEIPGPESNFGCPVPTPPPVETIKMSTPIKFEVDKTVINETSLPVLEEAVKRLKEEDKESYIIVDGYTDITGKPAYNKALSMKRAKAVRAQLLKMGVDPKRIKLVGHGAKQPAASNATPEGRMENRRAVMHLNMAD